ncbi:unnamed protein product [Mytilus edulis]|uniref:Ig-like domain-containing protein n=1 Tax=Mytilus edulis TaxID=6550 RepID=A0A8S3QAV9_MYTED|nr:unnamed protein product [Mytilus edulis]
MNYITDLVLTEENIYKPLGSSVKMVCPIAKTTRRPITWQGPSNYRVYAVGTDVSYEFSSQVKINVTDNKSILLIHRFTKDKSGKFRCSDTVSNRDFNVIIKSKKQNYTLERNPSDLVIVNATGKIITAVQGKGCDLECTVTSGQPGGNITWSTDGAVVARNGPSLVSYRFIPQRSDNGKLFKCEAFNSDGQNIMESSVLLKVFYIPKITFSPKQTLTVKEGKVAQLICCNDGNDPNVTNVWRRQHTQTIISERLALRFETVNRTDAGLYACRVDTKAGVYEDIATLIVQCK